MVDLSLPMTQERFGELVGISQPAVSDLVRRGVLLEGGSAGAWLLEYCHQLREAAAGRGGESALELAAERARLAKEQADRIAMQNAVTRGELAPAILLEQVLARAGSKAGRILESIPGALRRRRPDLTSEDIGAITAIVAKARNLAAAIRLADVVEEGDDDEDVVDLDVDGETVA